MKVESYKLGKILFSIAIPTFNEEQYLENCLKSIYRQKSRNSIEVFIVDDDSTDGTVEIAKRFKKKMNIRILRNGTKDPERGKKIALDSARGQFFMYLDADMELADETFFEKISQPFKDYPDMTGVLSRFIPKKNQNSLTRCISYDPFQRDPLLRYFTPQPSKTLLKKEMGYTVHKFKIGLIPCQSLNLYRVDRLRRVLKDEYHFMDNDVPVKLVRQGYNLFAYCPHAEVHHYFLFGVKEIWIKKLKGALRTYMRNLDKREYKWLNLDKKINFFLLGIFIILVNLLFPFLLIGIYRSIKYRDLACLHEPIIAIVSTDSLVYAFFKSRTSLGTLWRL